MMSMKYSRCATGKAKDKMGESGGGISVRSSTKREREMHKQQGECETSKRARREKL
jgi:hypothetical protein